MNEKSDFCFCFLEKRKDKQHCIQFFVDAQCRTELSKAQRAASYECMHKLFLPFVL